MESGPPLPSAARRALAGLGDGSGRTLVLAGPDLSGKTAILDRLRGALGRDGYAIADLRGTYRDRESAFGLVFPLDPDRGENSERQETAADDAADVTFGGGSFGPVPEEPARSRRARGTRQKGSIMGISYAVRTRGVHEVDATAWWRSFVDRVRAGTSRGHAILVEDGVYADAESRDFLLYLSDRARLRPLLIVLALDTEDPGYANWEEKLLGRTDVDWVRLTPSREDPREESRFRRVWEDLPEPSRRILALAALLGGSVPEVTLSRVARRSFGELASDLLPATETRIVRIEDGRVRLRRAGWARVIPGLVPTAVVREMHREIAEALEALHREPTLARRRELADHYFEWEAGPTALRYLLEAAEIAERLADHDAVAELTERGLACVPGLPEDDRPDAEVELRLFHARGLLLSGRPEEGQQELIDAVHRALEREVMKEALEEWLEPVVGPLLIVGARPSLETALGELADRCEHAGYTAAAVLLTSVVASHELERGRLVRARREARRAGHLARRLEQGPAQALAMMAVALTHLAGGPEERALSNRFLALAQQRFAASRRSDLQQLAEELRTQQLRLSGLTEEALEARLQAVPMLQRLRLPAVELLHQLGIAEEVFDTKPDRRSMKALARAGELVDQLHLTPPSPSILRYWILRGRALELVPDLAGARDRYAAVADRSATTAPAHLVDEARLRLARLELEDGRAAEAERWFTQVPTAAFPEHHKPSFGEWRAAAKASAASPRGRPASSGQSSEGNQPGSSA